MSRDPAESPAVRLYVGAYSSRGEAACSGFLEFAKAYQLAAETVSERLFEEEVRFGWPEACSCLFLYAHAYECLLKGAILFAEPGNARAKGHDVFFGLFEEWERVRLASALPLPEFEKRFDTHFLPGTEHCKTSLRDKLSRSESPSIFFRYPVDLNGQEWSSLAGFELVSFRDTLDGLAADIQEITDFVAARSESNHAP